MTGMFTQKRIAKMLDLTEPTISKWAKEYDWDKQKAIAKSMMDTNKAEVAKLLNYQLTVLSRIRALREKELENPELGLKELGDLLIPTKDADAVCKLFAQIKSDETKWDVLVRYCTELIDYVQLKNLNLAKEVVPIIEAYMLDKRL